MGEPDNARAEEGKEKRLKMVDPGMEWPVASHRARTCSRRHPGVVSAERHRIPMEIKRDSRMSEVYK